MQCNSQQSTDVQCAKECGPVRAMRLARDLGITTLGSLAEASVAELTTVWSVGEYTAKVMKGSAQGHMERIRAKRSASRIFVQMPDDGPEQMTGRMLRWSVELTIDELGHELGSEHLKVGYPEAVFSDQGTMRDFMEDWAIRHDRVETFGFPVDFGAHIEDHESASSEQYANAFAERRQRAFNWAHEVAIPLDDKHTDWFMQQARKEELPVVVGHRRFADEGGIEQSDETVGEQATIVSDPIGHDGGDWVRGADGKWEIAKNTSADIDEQWDVGFTPGREGDMNEPVDAHLTMAPNDRDDPRLDHDDLSGADPGGEGEPTSGKKDWSSGS